ncbi:MAG: TIGR02302 family protein [Pseudomonadota bacterium]
MGRSFDPQAFRSMVGWRLRLARVALAWERLWPALWPSLAAIGIFAAVALFDVLPHLPAWLHGSALALFGAVLGFTLYRARGAIAVPALTAGRRRLEIASGLSHRPLATLEDELAGGAGDPVADTLWQAHRARLVAALTAIRVGWPSPGLPRRDPMALRAVLFLTLVVGLGAAGEESWTRLARAFSPGIAAPVLPPGVLDMWITPPAYTGQSPLLPRAEAGEGELVVPAGSALLAQVTGGRGAPKLVIDGRTAVFSSVEGASGKARAYRAAAEIDAGARLAVEQDGRALAAWRLKVIPDDAPKVEFATAPARTRRAALRLEYAASDDYGIVNVAATIRRAEAPAGSPGQPIDLALPVPGQRLKEASGSSYYDLTAHPWAGLKVLVQLRAVDAIGQNGRSEDVATVLPERLFQHPVARAIVEQRKTLVADPGTRNLVSRALAAIGSVPSHYFDDVVVYLALKTASVRLLRDHSAGAVNAVQELLWDAALRIEDGKLSLAERELRALQQKLQDALANNATDAEIERLIQELQQAIDRYLEAMMENARNRPDDLARQPMDRNAQRVERLDLQRLLDQARQLARTGARDAARDLLARLQEILENLRAQQYQMGQQQGGEGQQIMQGLQELMQRQQGLIDRTFRRAQRGQSGQRGQRGPQGQQGQPGEGDEEAGDGAEQEGLRRMLGDLMRQFGELMGDIPGGFGRAERAMRDAIDALTRNAPGRALRPQMEALDQLRAGARELMQQMLERFGQGPGDDDMLDGEPEQASDRDPAGRPLNGLGGLDGRDVRIPEEADLQRSREILDELLRRAGERFRPMIEREYIERLLKRF